MADSYRPQKQSRQQREAKRHILRQAVVDGIVQPMPHLTERQATCLRWIFSYYITQLVYPTRREIMESMGVNSTSAESYIRPLVNKGFLTIDSSEVRKRGRNIRLTRLGLTKLSVMGVPGEYPSELFDQALGEGGYAKAAGY